MNAVSAIVTKLKHFHRFPYFSPVFSQYSKENDIVIDPPENIKFDIPKPKERINEPIEQQKARLVYQSRKRGMLENDLLLSTFAAKYLKDFNDQETREYDKLINGPSNDWDIYYWATNVKPTPSEYDTKIMDLLKEHSKNLKKESRIRQPDLY